MTMIRTSGSHNYHHVVGRVAEKIVTRKSMTPSLQRSYYHSLHRPNVGKVRNIICPFCNSCQACYNTNNSIRERDVHFSNNGNFVFVSTKRYFSSFRFGRWDNGFGGRPKNNNNNKNNDIDEVLKSNNNSTTRTFIYNNDNESNEEYDNILNQQQQQQNSNNDNSSTDQQQKNIDMTEEDDPNTIKPTVVKKATTTINQKVFIRKLMGKSLQPPAGRLWEEEKVVKNTIPSSTSLNDPTGSNTDGYISEQDHDYIPQVSIRGLLDGRRRKRVLILCTGGTLCMAPDPKADGALAPVQGALSSYMKNMNELQADHMPDIVLHEYCPFYDSSDLGPADWSRVANDIRANYLDFDGFVILSGTDTMAYFATALSFMLENLGKPVVFTGSQIPLCQPYNDARRNLIMALIFASREETSMNEVTIFFHDRLLRACRATKVNTHSLKAFDSPNQDPLATIGVTINENEHLFLPPPKGQLRVHSRMDTRILTLRLVPGFDDGMIREIIKHNIEHKLLQAMILQLYGTGNLPSVKNSLIELLADANDLGILVVASTQCFRGSVLMGQYAVGKALETAGVVSANDMTVEAIACKIAYLFGRTDLTFDGLSKLMGISLRGEITPIEQLSTPPFASVSSASPTYNTYQQQRNIMNKRGHKQFY